MEVLVPLSTNTNTQLSEFLLPSQLWVKVKWWRWPFVRRNSASMRIMLIAPGERGEGPGAVIYLLIYCWLIAKSTAQGHLRAFHKFKFHTQIEYKTIQNMHIKHK